jgi:hypothetical protein
MRLLHLLGLAAVIGLAQAAQNPALARGGHGGHGHGGHRSHGHGGHGHHGGAHTAHAHHSGAHGAHTGARRGGAFAHHHGVHTGHYAGYHSAWAHHYANHWHNWGYHNGWGYHHGWGWGNGWNWYGGGVNVGPSYVGPNYVNPGYVGPPGVVVVPPGTNAPVAPGNVGFNSLLGTIRTINGPAISVATEDGDPITIDATPSTTIVLNSRQATLADLQPSDRVKVRYDNDLKALTLVAMR